MKRYLAVVIYDASVGVELEADSAQSAAIAALDEAEPISLCNECSRSLNIGDPINAVAYDEDGNEHYDVQGDMVERIRQQLQGLAAPALDANLQPGIYRHYKGNLYRVFSVATHTETQEKLVVYQALHGDFGVYTRPLGMFTGVVNVTGAPEPRFSFVDSENTAHNGIA